MALEEYSSAEKSFLVAISLDKHHCSGYVNLGSFCFNRRPLEALHHLETGVSLSSGVSHSLFNLGYCHLLLGRFKPAGPTMRNVLIQALSLEIAFQVADRFFNP